ncbi:MAG: hypothetical protein ACPG3X_03125 [Opitutales bacterium]
MGDAAQDYFSKHLNKLIDWQLNALTSDDIILFEKAKDRPVLISALACKPDALLTLDRADFHERLGQQFYGIAIRTPGEWLMEQRESGAL